MSVSTETASLAWNRDQLPQGPAQDAVIKGITGEIAGKGFVVAKGDLIRITDLDLTQQ